MPNNIEEVDYQRCLSFIQSQIRQSMEPYLFEPIGDRIKGEIEISLNTALGGLESYFPGIVSNVEFCPEQRRFIITLLIPGYNSITMDYWIESLDLTGMEMADISNPGMADISNELEEEFFSRR